MKLQELLAQMYAAPTRDASDELYAKHFDKSLAEEGFNPATCGLISSEAYDRGHSAGRDEVVSHTINLSIFVRDIIKAQG